MMLVARSRRKAFRRNAVLFIMAMACFCRRCEGSKHHLSSLQMVISNHFIDIWPINKETVTTHPSVLTFTTVWINQATVARTTSMIDSAVMRTTYRQCPSRSVRRQTKGAPSLTVASVASSLLQVKTLLIPSPPAKNLTGLVRSEHIHSSVRISCSY
jgi:hypothetical protein